MTPEHYAGTLLCLMVFSAAVAAVLMRFLQRGSAKRSANRTKPAQSTSKT